MLVSLIMPVWAPRSDWLRAAVASALGQTGCEIELIVVDDGSETPVAELLSGFEDSRMRILRVPHGRVSRARNAGLEVARGHYIRYVDSDDVIVADSTAHLVGLTRKQQDVVVYGATVVCDERLHPLSTVATRLEGHVAEACLLNRFETTIHSLLYPRAVVDAVGPWEPAIVVSQDWDYALRAFELVPVRGDSRVATYYRTHPSMNSRDAARGIEGYRLVVDRYFERHPEQRGVRLSRRAEVEFHLFAAAQLTTRLGRPREALGHVENAFAVDLAATLAALPRHTAMPVASLVGRLRRIVSRV
jgi:glycosyltransferase involved in cell wall biosynthesis